MIRGKETRRISKIMVDYNTFSKYSTDYTPDIDIGYINGRDLSVDRIRRTSRPLKLGTYIQSCPIVRLTRDSEAISVNHPGMIEVDIDFYIRLSRPDSEVLDDDAWAHIELTLSRDGDIIRKIRDTKVGLGVHRLSIRCYVDVCRHDRLEFRMRLLDAGEDLVVDYYNDDLDVFTFGTIRLLR